MYFTTPVLAVHYANDEFEVTLVKWGNSLGFILPKPIRDGMKLKAGGKIRIVLENNRIFIEKAKE